MNKINLLLIISGTFCALGGASSLASQFMEGDSFTQITHPDDAAPSHLMIAGILPKDGEDMYEIEFWNSIKDSTHAEDYEAYLKSFPNGRFAPLAKVRIERYRSQSQPTVQTEEEHFQVKDFTDRYEVMTNTNVRRAPSSDSEKIGELQEGALVDVTGQVIDKNWYRINIPTGGTGYVYAPLLAKPAPPPERRHEEVATPKPHVSSQPVTADNASKDCPDCPEMVAISPGSFTMGDDKGDRSEKPAHHVTITKPYALGKYEVTVGEWKACVKADACKKVSDEIMSSDNVPVRDVSWGDASHYVAWLSKITGKKYRLPTEAEWEYATRAGTKTRYWWGDQIEPGKAYCKDCGGTWDQMLPAAVGSFEPNPFGLYDMNGNVWEWVNDCWHRNYEGAPRDGSSWDDNNCTVRVIRSGSWRNDKTYVHSASRFKYDAYVRYLLNGFRVAKSLE